MLCLYHRILSSESASLQATDQRQRFHASELNHAIVSERAVAVGGDRPPLSAARACLASVCPIKVSARSLVLTVPLGKHCKESHLSLDAPVSCGRKHYTRKKHNLPRCVRILIETRITTHPPIRKANGHGMFCVISR